MDLMSEVWDKIIQVRMHGRGGQGAALASAILALAVFKEGKYVNSFPGFGSERRGAPVATFVKVSEEELMPKCKVYQADMLTIFDNTLIDLPVVFDGLKENGLILINVPAEEQEKIIGRLKKELNVPKGVRVFMVDASNIAIKAGLGAGAIPAINAAMLGAFAKASGLVQMDSLIEALKERLPANMEKNIDAARKAHASVEEVGTI